MPIVLVRIDDRLVHGQVVESWIPYCKISTVVVVSDAAAEDATQKMLMRLALPEETTLEVLSAAAAKDYLSGLPSGAGRVMVLAPGPREVLGLLEGGIDFSSVNVGGLHYSAGRVQLGKMIFLDEEDKRAMQAILARGVSLEGQAVPSEKKADLAELFCDDVPS